MTGSLALTYALSVDSSSFLSEPILDRDATILPTSTAGTGSGVSVLLAAVMLEMTPRALSISTAGIGSNFFSANYFL